MKLILLALLMVASLLRADAAPVDALLSQVEAVLPRGWKMTFSSSQGPRLSFVRDGDICVLNENRINAPMPTETEAQLEARVRKTGVRSRCYVAFRLEPKWTPARWSTVNQKNAQISREIEALPKKHGITDLYDARASRKGFEIYTPRDDDDRTRIRAWQQEAETLQRTLLPLPNYESSQYSLFLATRQGVEDDMHFVSPRSASSELYRIEALLQKHCPLPARVRP